MSLNVNTRIAYTHHIHLRRVFTAFSYRHTSYIANFHCGVVDSLTPTPCINDINCKVSHSCLYCYRYYGNASIYRRGNRAKTGTLNNTTLPSCVPRLMVIQSTMINYQLLFAIKSGEYVNEGIALISYKPLQLEMNISKSSVHTQVHSVPLKKLVLGRTLKYEAMVTMQKVALQEFNDLKESMDEVHRWDQRVCVTIKCVCIIV